MKHPYPPKVRFARFRVAGSTVQGQRVYLGLMSMVAYEPMILGIKLRLLVSRGLGRVQGSKASSGIV